MSRLLGHDRQIAAFRTALATGPMHHAWLLTGPRGIGKGMFARAASARYLAEGAGQPPPGDFAIDAEHPTARLIAAGSHPDYRLLERIEKIDRAGDKTGDRARNIAVDQVRALQRLFASTPGLSPRRAVVVDAADDLEPAAANALLKNLEEPPADTLFLLVSHAPGRLLPTIRSRCRSLRFQLLDADVMTAMVRAASPDSDPRELAALVRAGEGAPGRALAFAGLGIAELDVAMDRLVREGDPTSAMRAALARSLSGKAAQPRYEAFLGRVPPRIAAHARTLDGDALANALGLWEQARSIAGGAVPLSLDPQATVFELAGLLAALAPEASRAKA